MVAPVGTSLDDEHIFGIAEVSTNALRHLIKGEEEPGEDALVGPNQGILRVSDIEDDISIVGVDNRLHAVTDVVYPAGILCGIGVAVAGGIGVLYPE